MLARCWRLFSRGRGSSPRPERRRKAPVLEPLEDRLELAANDVFVIPAVTATAKPNVLFPPNGRFVPVEVQGTVTVYQVVDGKSRMLAPSEVKTPPLGNLQLIDEYRRLGANRIIPLTPGATSYRFDFTIHLQASRSTEFEAGRRYYLVVAARTGDGSGGTVLPVQVPISLKDRGQPPQKIPAKPYRPIHPTKPSSGSLFGKPKKGLF